MFDWVDLAGFLLTGAIVLVFGLAFHALPAETQRRWRLPVVLIAGTVAVLVFVWSVWMLLTYRP
jgi:multisubunit Na+/H+ antiporter MnhB subunit